MMWCDKTIVSQVASRISFICQAGRQVSSEGRPCEVKIIFGNRVSRPAKAPIPPAFELLMCNTSGFIFLIRDMISKQALKSLKIEISLLKLETKCTGMPCCLSFATSGPGCALSNSLMPHATDTSYPCAFAATARSKTYFCAPPQLLLVIRYKMLVRSWLVILLVLLGWWQLGCTTEKAPHVFSARSYSW